MWVVRKGIGIIGEKDDSRLRFSSRIESCAFWMLQLLDLNRGRCLSRQVPDHLTPSRDPSPGPV